VLAFVSLLAFISLLVLAFVSVLAYISSLLVLTFVSVLVFVTLLAFISLLVLASVPHAAVELREITPLVVLHGAVQVIRLTPLWVRDACIRCLNGRQLMHYLRSSIVMAADLVRSRHDLVRSRHDLAGLELTPMGFGELRCEIGLSPRRQMHSLSGHRMHRLSLGLDLRAHRINLDLQPGPLHLVLLPSLLLSTEKAQLVIE